MDKINRAIEILRKDGIHELFDELYRWFKFRINSAAWLTVYKIREIIFNNYIILINGVKIDANYDAISKSVKKRIQTKNYESAEVDLIQEHIKRDLPVVDLGAGIGYTTCIADRQTIESVPVIGIEANPKMIPIIDRTKRLNSAKFDIIEAGYHSESQVVEFYLSEDFWSSSTSERYDKKQTQIKVSGKSLRDILEENSMTGNIQLIIDIEGAEHDLIINESSLLRDRVDTLIIEFHEFADNEIIEDISTLEDLGFEVANSQGFVYCFVKTHK